MEKTEPKLAHQLELERLYNKNQTISRIRTEFEKEGDGIFSRYMSSNGIDPEFGYDLLTQMVLHKRITLPTLVGILKRHFEKHHNACQLVADMLLKAAQADLVDWDPVTNQFIILYSISQDVQDDLDKYQYPLPMVVPPQELKTNRDTGYYLSRNSVILRKNHHDEDVCLDYINQVNRMRLSINYQTATMIKNQWRNLDKPKEGETKADYQRRVKAFNKYDKSSKEVIEKLLTYGNEFYLTHKYDKRGRVYCQGYHISYQSAPWNKAIIELADKEIVPL